MKYTSFVKFVFCLAFHACFPFFFQSLLEGITTLPEPVLHHVPPAADIDWNNLLSVADLDVSFRKIQVQNTRVWFKLICMLWKGVLKLNKIPVQSRREWNLNCVFSKSWCLGKKQLYFQCFLCCFVLISPSILVFNYPSVFHPFVLF